MQQIIEWDKRSPSGHYSYYRASPSTTATATDTPETKNVIGRIRKNQRHCILKKYRAVFCKGLAKLGNIVAETMFPVMFPGVAKLGNTCFGRKICVREAKMFLTPDKNIFCFRAAKFVSATMFPTFSQALTDLFCLSITSHVTIPRKAFPCTVGHSYAYARTQTTKVETRPPRYRHMICIGKQNRQAKRVYLTTFTVILNTASNSNLHFSQFGVLKYFYT